MALEFRVFACINNDAEDERPRMFNIDKKEKKKIIRRRRPRTHTHKHTHTYTHTHTHTHTHTTHTTTHTTHRANLRQDLYYTGEKKRKKKGVCMCAVSHGFAACKDWRTYTYTAASSRTRSGHTRADSTPYSVCFHGFVL